jgi:molybdopterin converting factor small subunit
LLNHLAEKLGGDFTELVFDCRGRPAAYCRFLVNGRDIHFLNGFDTALVEGDTVTIIPPIAGG